MTTPRFSRSALAAGAAAIGALGAIGVAQLGGSANPVMQFTQAQATSDPTTPTAAPAKDDATKAKADKEGCADKEPLDAATEAKVKEAALAAVPGATFRHAREARDSDGYKALLTKADGVKVLVHEDAAFNVTKVEDPAPERKGRGHRDAHLDAATEAKVKDAALAAVPGATFRHAHEARDGDGYKALLTKADGTKVLVHEDDAFTVTKVEDPAPARKGRGHHGPRPADAPAAERENASFSA